MGAAFFEPLGDGVYRSTEHTAGPWSAESQHMGPPTALLVRAMEALPASFDGAIARVTVEILGPVPVADLQVVAAVERPGRSVELLSAEIRADGRPVVRGRAWRIVASDTTSVVAGAADPLPPPQQGTQAFRADGWGAGYLDAMEWRMLSGAFDRPGPATVWARQLVDLVADETPSPLQRLSMVADSGNGVSGRLDPTRWWFINSELTVHLHRLPDGEWIGLDANTVIGPTGVGLAHSTLHDLGGAVGQGAQALMIRSRAV